MDSTLFLTALLRHGHNAAGSPEGSVVSIQLQNPPNVQLSATEFSVTAPSNVVIGAFFGVQELSRLCCEHWYLVHPGWQVLAQYPAHLVSIRSAAMNEWAAAHQQHHSCHVCTSHCPCLAVTIVRPPAIRPTVNSNPGHLLCHLHRCTLALHTDEGSTFIRCDPSSFV